ncbi:carbon-nitrogen hydrolase family protein [Natronolimnohabitans sp. A-GB9]|uniref:carbon-nitrogen hydrolase family protein n=1 Tax=Natronolimnohabitans sp. A-GB9 TaxID=3069757 RepID=UPI0027B021BA|nr:carbon-nitrogen hydrolase family protein [Natronolimnohabitans sp. A-GB9]MDQ2050868.1 carbon-nitrogen hydrolase family protein [Natronolimnohabitans sp. A-GB9]
MSLDTVALVQFDPTVGPADDGTLERLCDRIRTVGAESEPDLIVFPELATTGYSIFDRVDAYAQPVPGPTTRAVGDAAADAGAHVLLGMAVRDECGVRNSAVWLDRSGAVRARYDKRNLWGDERPVFRSGDDVLVLECEGRTIGVQICYDLNFPQQAAAFARAEIDALVNLSAWSVPMAGDWNRLLPARAIETGAYVFGCNRAGADGDLELYGHSTAYEPDGSIAGRLDADPGVLVTQLSDGPLERERERNPMRRDRRDDRPVTTRITIDSPGDT